MERPPPNEEDVISNTLRLPKSLNERMRFRANQRYGGNTQMYLMSLVIQDVELPSAPNCADCGFRRMAEFIIEQLRQGRPS